MRIYDVTLTITPTMTTWPGDPIVILERMKKIEEGANANVSHLDLGVHTGTHVDAPYHFLMEGAGIDTLPLDVLVGPVQVVELGDDIGVIDAKVVEKAGIVKGTCRVVFKTHNSTYWAQHTTEFQPTFVGVSVDGAEALVKLGIKLVGIDYLSVAPYKKSRPTHEVLLKASMVIVEGMDLSAVSAGLYQLYCLPLKLGGADGAPARVIMVGD
jgi:arylformamidase